ncbi:MAG TPA: radical SAM family heme chaperone HemW [Burkholderiales bacterium]|nr:radical SAM family heme chaperone HemW [Burkholderiales bacterium]
MSNLNLTQLPPLSLYIHMPWCIKKCPYCDFNSHGLKGTLPEQEYIDSLIMDLEQALPLIWGRSIQTIFIGGGTPSLFSGEAIDRLISCIRSRIKISPYAEITLEANPGTVEKHYIAEYAAAGVNRISLGIQSFNDQHLKVLGRIHSANEARQAIETVADNFANFNLDIIYGLPKQSSEEAINDIQQAINAKPTHISAYNLTIEPNTHFAKFIPEHLPEDDLCYQMQDAIISTLANNGYQRYEISAFARNNLQSQHNRNYWEFGDYLGIGAGAHSKLSFHDRIIRQMRHKHPAQYMERVKLQQHIDENKLVTSQELPFEFMMNALRLRDGFVNALFTQTTGQSFNSILPQLLKAQEQGFIELSYNKVIPTAKGRDFLNNLLELFL